MSRWIVHSHAAFTARHGLVRYRGLPEQSHEHRWEIAIEAGFDTLNGEGYAADFDTVHALLRAAVAPLDGIDLNRHPEIGLPSPTAERLAEVLATRLAGPLAELGGRLVTITVWEGPDNRIDYHPDRCG
jgi:6-pyruvoyl-tetrahydropterin synthase